MRADSAFVAGQSHHDTAKPCQDYALSGATPALTWALVSDGCSTAGNTDVGARMWAHAARRWLAGLPHLPGSLAEAREGVLNTARPLLAPFEPADAFATLGLVAGERNKACALLFGDGLLAAGLQDGSWETWEVVYEQNAPRYLAYDLTPGAPEQWSEMVGDSAVLVEWRRFTPTGSLVGSRADRHRAAEYPGLWLEWPSARELDFLLACSDGVGSVDGRDSSDMVRELLNVKNPAGQFMQRRMGAMARQWKKGTAPAPMDDLAAGLLYFDEHSDSGAS